MFVIYILKLDNSTYLHLKNGYFRVGMPLLCLHSSLRLAVFSPAKDIEAASLITITTAVAAWIATWENTDWIASAYAISS